jgi:uncharacterized protein YndB with AHSA1/START domain
MSRHGSLRVTLPTSRSIRMARAFDAPASAVFTAWTTPRYVQRWWGSDSAPVVVCDIDLRVGGVWRFVTRDVADGTELAWRGVYLEIDEPRRLVSTQVFEPHPEGEATNTMTLEERDRVTYVTIDVECATREHRDRALASGMERGMQLTMDRLEDLVRPATQEDSTT